MAPHCEVGVDHEFERAESEFLEPPDLGLGEVLKRDISQRRAAPHCERHSQRDRRVRRPAGIEGTLPVPYERTKEIRVQVTVLDREEIATVDRPQAAAVAGIAGALERRA